MYDINFQFFKFLNNLYASLKLNHLKCNRSTAQKMKFSVKDWSNLLKKSLMENFIFCTVEASKIEPFLEFFSNFSSMIKLFQTLFKLQLPTRRLFSYVAVLENFSLNSMVSIVVAYRSNLAKRWH